MRRTWMIAGVFALSCVIAGCDDSGSATVTEDQAQGAKDALKKWQAGHNKPQSKDIGAGSSPAAIAGKKRR